MGLLGAWIERGGPWKKEIWFRFLASGLRQIGGYSRLVVSSGDWASQRRCSVSGATESACGERENVRNTQPLERWLSGLRRTPGKREYIKSTVGSNPSLSASA